jgi:hypothetical protein
MLLLLAVGLLAPSAAAPAVARQRIEISGEPIVDLLARAWRPSVAAAIVRPHPFVEPEAWIVEQAIAGAVRVGERLAFSRCSPVLRVGSTPDHLRSLLARSPVVEAEADGERALLLPPWRDLASFAPARDSDRFLLLFEPRPEGAWAFAVQTVGDLYLLRGERVFRLAWRQRDRHPVEPAEQIWAPVSEVSARELIDRVRAGLAEAGPQRGSDPAALGA